MLGIGSTSSGYVHLSVSFYWYRHLPVSQQLVVEEYRRFATPEAFWATHKTYTAALEESRKRRMAEVEVLAERVMTTQGSDLEAKGAHNIAKKYLTLARLGALPHPDTQLHEDIKDFYDRY